MKGVVFGGAGAEPQVVDNLEKPRPSADQILVKSIYTAINPVDSLMSGTGLLVTAWPFVLGCDAAGIVVQVGVSAADKFKLGDEVCGCTRLGVPGHSTAQEYFLMDAALTIPKPKNISIQQAATIGVGTLTAALGLFNGLRLPLPDLEKLADKSKDGSEQLRKDSEKDWVVVLGGASSVGKYGIQIAKAAGYNVAASCSPSSAQMVKDLGAVPFNYKEPLEQQVKEVMSITSDKPFRILDAAATGDGLARELFKNLSDGEKLFATTNDWSNITDFEGSKTYAIELGVIGRAEATDLNADIEKFIPLIVGLVENERVLPSPYDIVGLGGFQDAIEALKYQKKGAGGSNKVLAKLQDP